MKLIYKILLLLILLSILNSIRIARNTKVVIPGKSSTDTEDPVRVIKTILLLDNAQRGEYSPDGKKISWGQSPDMTIRGWYGWELAVGDFVTNGDNFSVQNIKTYKPNDVNGYYESDDFTIDGNTLLLCGNLEPNQQALEMDAYTYNTDTGNLTNLTNSDDWDESPLYSYDNTKIAWLSSKNQPPLQDGELWWQNGRSEFWIMDADGSNKQQITTFNAKGTDDYKLVGGKRTISNYIDWHPNGRQLLGSITVNNDNEKGFEEKLMLIEIE